jgi:hypothetical protein
MIITLIEDEILPAVPMMSQMDQDRWRIFAINLQGAMRRCELLLSLFGAKVDVEIVVLVLDLYEKRGRH